MTDIFDEKTGELIPFHAINEFMRNDFRFEVVRSTLVGLNTVPDNLRSPIERLTKKMVKVPGFRHSDKAPTAVRINPTVSAFEKSPDLVAAILNAWAEMHAPLRQQVYDLLIERSWQVLPLEAERTKLPGFFIKWPKGEDFEKLNDAFKEKYPEANTDSDNVSLMIVWVSSRLPYLKDEEEEGTEDTEVRGQKPEDRNQ